MLERFLLRSKGFQAALLACSIQVAACGDDVTAPLSSATQLEFAVQPTASGVGDALAPAVVVVARNGAGNVVRGWTQDVTLSLASEGSGSALDGTTTVLPVGGTAVFGQLVLTAPASEVRLVARSGALEQAVSEPFQIYGQFRAASVSSGYYHNCALTDDGSAYCWGENTYGQLGDGTSTDRFLPTPVATEARFTAIHAGSSHTCGLTTGGNAYCWGHNWAGEVGAPTSEFCGSSPCSTTPVEVSGGHTWTQLGLGRLFTCGLAASGEMYCWGINTEGQGGRASQDVAPVPTPVSGEHRFTQITVGFQHACGITSAGEALCWGGNVYGEVGDGTGERQAEPVPVAGGPSFRALVAGGANCHGHTCGITVDGSTYCWGRSYQGLQPRWRTAPDPLLGDPGFESVAIGGSGVCGLSHLGALYCWGEGRYGQMGQGNTEASPEPVTIRPDLRFTMVSSGRYHSCAVAEEGAVYCWGSNTTGQLGHDLNPAGWTVPVRVWSR